ncbi:putative PGI1-glucose-6-phosphate isomerase [Flagelloscypha sp. PMI_526]|nr:putative PGI1-glucose-6-phosphate isomerase [Flagelloscypha sp. PMI_526]
MPGTLASDYPSWAKLQSLYDSDKSKLVLKDLFASDPDRFKKYSRIYNSPSGPPVEFLLDFSKNLINDDVLTALITLAEEAGVEGRVHVHVSEPGVDEVPGVLKHMYEFANQSGLANGQASLEKDQEYCEHRNWRLRLGSRYFVSNVDGTHIAETVRDLDPETTLFIIASKTFTTQETITNATSAKDWFTKPAEERETVSKHFVALSTNAKAVSAFGIDTKNMFPFWDWLLLDFLLPILLGPDVFAQLLEGAHAMDKHFKTTPLKDNLPVLLALLGIWYGDFYGSQTHALLPYDQYLHKGDMESNGKFVTKLANAVSYETGPIIWGASGTNGQHSFYQLRWHLGRLRVRLFKNLGRVERGMKALVKSKVFEGNRPSNSILIGGKLDPAALGALIALYEHKIFTPRHDLGH